MLVRKFHRATQQHYYGRGDIFFNSIFPTIHYSRHPSGPLPKWRCVSEYQINHAEKMAEYLTLLTKQNMVTEHGVIYESK